MDLSRDQAVDKLIDDANERAIEVTITDSAKELCARCGYEGHKASECEHPFPQGHSAKQKRSKDWSYLSSQVVGGEL